MKRMFLRTFFTWKNIFFATLVHQATKARARGLFLASKTQLFLAVKLQVFHLYKYKNIARQKEEVTHIKIQENSPHTQTKIQKLSQQQTKPFLSHHHHQQTNKNQTKQSFFSFFLSLTLPTKVHNLFSLSLSLSRASLSVSLPFFLRLFYVKHTLINPECSGPKLTVNIIFFA